MTTTDSDWGRLPGEVERQKMELSELRGRMDTYERLLGENTKATQDTRNMVAVNTAATNESLSAVLALTSEARDWWSAGEKGFRVLGWLGTAAKWVGTVAAGLWAAYEAYRRWRG